VAFIGDSNCQLVVHTWRYKSMMQHDAIGTFFRKHRASLVVIPKHAHCPTHDDRKWRAHRSGPLVTRRPAS
jgi:hypothetical protein